MLQDLFRFLGLRQDAESIALVKETLAAVGRGHPVRQYLRMTNDLGADTGLVDTFLHVRDMPYTVADCLELVADAGLAFQGWDENGFYYPESQVSGGGKLRARIRSSRNPRSLEGDGTFQREHPRPLVLCLSPRPRSGNLSHSVR